MSIGRQNKSDEYPLVIRWRDLYDKEHELKVKYNVDKADGFYFQTYQVSDGSSFVISKFDGDRWILANTLKKDETLMINEDELANKLGELGELYNKLDELLTILKGQK